MATRAAKNAAQRAKIVSPDPKRHVEGLIDLTAKVFGGDYYQSVRNARRGLQNGHRPLDWQASAVAVLDGQVMAQWVVTAYRMRIGRATVRVAGIGAVTTHGDYRKLGLMAGTATASLAKIRRRGYDLSILFGIPGFYHRFGYVRAWCGTDWTVSAGDLPADGGSKRKLRRFAVRYRPDLDRLYNRTHAHLTGTAVRPVYQSPQINRNREGYLWSDRSRRAAGYVIVSRGPDGLTCCEAAGPADAILQALGLLCRRRHCPKVHLAALHYDSDLCRQLRRGSCTSRTHYLRNGGALVRTINLPSTLEKMARELTRRIRMSHLRSWRGTLRIADRREAATLRITRAGIRVVPDRPCRHAVRGSDHVAQLLIGTHEPMETVEAAGMRLRGDARQLVEVLFPVQHPMLGVRDRF